LKSGEAVTISRAGSAPLSVSRTSEGLLCLHNSVPIQFNSQSRKISLADSAGQTMFSEVSIDWRLQARPGAILPERKAGTEYFDAERVGPTIILRHWRKGDRFQPIGMPTALKLQDLFVNQKVPRALRHQLVVAESAKGGIFWVEGMRISERFQLT